MPEAAVERAIEEHGHVLRTATQSTDTVHLPDPDDPYEDTDCYATHGVPKRVLESSGQVPMGATLCALCQGAETGAPDTAENTAEAVRTLAREDPETVDELLGETDRVEDGTTDRIADGTTDQIEDGTTDQIEDGTTDQIEDGTTDRDGDGTGGRRS